VTKGCGTGNLIAAIGEAAFMTGIERNSDVVVMASYAPLFANVNYKAWNPDAINFDASRCYGTPSYYVQQMFATSRPDVVLPVELRVPAPTSKPTTAASADMTLFACAGAKGDEVIVKVVNASAQPQEVEMDLGDTGGGWRVRATELTSAKPDDENSLDQPRKVAPAEHELIFATPGFTHAFPAYSVTVMRMRRT
jgi:alpha-N-arabinofuranosidase